MRLDNFLVEKQYFETRTKAKQAITRGEIFIDGIRIEKPSFNVEDGVNVKRFFNSEYVSNGGFKMEKALRDFGFSVANLICADIGASTGGFTDCLIQNGAKTVYAVDLNDGQLHSDLKKNKAVKQLVCNVKNLTKSFFDENIDLVVADLSFISATIVMPVFYDILDKDKYLILLVKPQFEVGRKRKFKNGIVNDPCVRKNACLNVLKSAGDAGFSLINITSAPLVEGKNTEYLMLFQKKETAGFDISLFDFGR